MQAVYRAWHDACSDSGGRWECLVPGSCVMEQTFCELRWVTAGMAFGVFWSEAGDPEYKKFSDFGGRRGWYVMYKDVWKKFGVKIFIVLCSVLLIGGVAVAAPRLRADVVNGKPTFSVLTGSGIKISLAGKAQYNYGEDVEPEVISIKGDGYDLILRNGKDFSVRTGGNVINDVTQTAKVFIAALDGSEEVSRYNSDGSEDFTELEVTYEISRRDIDATWVDAEYIKASDLGPENVSNKWIEKKLPASFNGADWKVTINEPDIGTKVLSYGTDYKVDKQAEDVGSYSGEINFLRFNLLNGTKKSATATVYMEVSGLEISENTDGTVKVEKVIGSNRTVLTAGTHYTPVYNGNVCTITGIYSGGEAYYVGETQYTTSKPVTDYTLGWTPLESTVDYNDLKGIEQKPAQVWVIDNKDGSRTYLNEGSGYELKYTILNGAQGATAGTVEMTITAKAPYNKAEKVRYNLRRKLALNDMNIEKIPRNQNESLDKITFNGEGHIVDIEISFNDTGSKLEAGKDYDIFYKLINAPNASNNSTDWVTNVSELIHAGEVAIKIVGKADGSGNINKPGYYGIMDGGDLNAFPVPEALRYTIHQLDLLKEGYSLELRNSSNRVDNLFDVSCEADDIINRAVVSSGKSSYKMSLLGNGEFTPTFYHPSGAEIQEDEWGNLKPDEGYKVKLSFNGDLTGDLETTFKIDKYNAKDIAIVFAGCTECGSSATEHIYTGEQHMPIVTGVTHKGILLDPDDYEITFGDNINAGRNVGTVTVNIGTGENAVSKTEKFDIKARAIDNGKLDLVTFGGSTSGRTHVYCGLNQGPDVPKLKLIDTSDGKNPELLKDVDYTLTAGIFNVNGNPGDKPVPFDQVQIGEEYCFRVTSKGNNFKNTDGTTPVTYVETVPFTFERRSILSKDEDDNYEITARVNPSPKPDLESNEQGYIDYIKKHIDVTDAKYNNEKLRIDVDYSIVGFENSISNDGTVKFKIQGEGCYSGTSLEKLELPVGTHIKNLHLRENGAHLGQPAPIASQQEPSAEITLKGTYATDPTNIFNIVFNATTDISANQVDLCTGQGTPTIPKGEKGNADAKYWVSLDKGYEYDAAGVQYASAILTGINGYHGKIKVKFKVEKQHLAYDGFTIEIVYPKDANGQSVGAYTYTGSNIEAIIIIKDKNGDRVPGNYTELFDITYENNLNATNGYVESNKETGAIVRVTGKPSSGFEGTISEHYKIDPQSIVGKDSDGKDVLLGKFLARGLKASYPYRPYTILSADNVPSGVWPTFELVFSANGNPNGGSDAIVLSHAENGDYVYTCINADKVTQESDDKLAKLRITGKGNFTGTVDIPYRITPVSLSEDNEDIKITIDGPSREPFTGIRYAPKVKVVQTVDLGNGKKVEMTVPSEQYTATPVNTLWVSENTLSGIGSQTCVRIEKKEVDGVFNYNGERNVAYFVYGELSPSKPSQGDDNSEVEVTTSPIPYSENISYDGYVKVNFKQKQDGQTDYTGGNNTDAEGEFLSKIRPLKYREEFTVSCLDETVGIHSGYIVGDENYFIGRKYIASTDDNPIVIQGNLRQAEVIWKKGVAAVPFGKDVKIQDYITIECGGRELNFDEDYTFKANPDLSKLGETSVTIIPTDEAADIDPATGKEGNKAYLTGDLPVKFNVVAELENDNVIGLKDVYTYIGEPVINPSDIVVTGADGKPLKRNEDYIIEGYEDAINVGSYVITIKGISPSYMGSEITHRFKIEPYVITEENVAIKFEGGNPVATYTGDIVFPKIASISVPTTSGSLVLKAGDEDNPADYEMHRTEKGDNINWTNPKLNQKPSFVIVGVGNFTGQIEMEYIIEPRSITEAKFDEIKDEPYQNNRPIKPIPTGKFGSLQLTGIPFDNNLANDYQYWTDNTTHFAYWYDPAEPTSIGTKTIKIRGIGNFTGETALTFEIVPLNIELADLVFKSSESPVYDGQEKTPAFELRYKGDVILEWTGTKVISENISTATITWENNIHASTEDKSASVLVSLASTGDNYYGSKSKSFAILPASLKDHVKFMYLPTNQSNVVDLNSYQLKKKFEKPELIFATNAPTPSALLEDEIGIYYNYPQMANHGYFLGAPGETTNFTFERVYVEPDTDDVEEVREGYTDENFTYAGKVKCTITGTGDYTDSATFWYFIGTDISDADVNVTLKPTTAVFNSTLQKPELKITGLDEDQYSIVYYRGETVAENRITEQDFINAATYYIRLEGQPSKGTYASKPKTLTYTITPRAFSNNLVIDGFKREYSYTGYDICPVGISVTDYIGKIKYKLTEDVDYTLTYTNNLNAGTAYINIKGQNNFSGSATANFMITSSTISSGGWGGNNSFLDQGTGEISGSTAVSPNEVNMSMDTIDAMYYTGKPVYPKVSIAGMTENIDYTVTFSNNVEVGTAVATVNGIGNNKGTITKNFRIIAQLSKCTISPIPAQQYTGSEVKPALTVKCGNSILMEGTDYTVTYSNNINIGTATATLRALNNANYTGTASVKFSIGNDVGGFIISGYAPSYAYTGKAITPGVVVETGSRTLVPGTEYTVSYSNNVNAGTATITVTGVGKYSGKQTANFVIEPKNIQSCDTTDIADRTYTGDAYTPSVTVSDGGKVLTKGVDYTVTYTNNTNPGTATVVIRGLSSNYAGTKVISFKISAVAVKGLKATNVKYNSMKLKWTKQGYADGYQLCDSKSKVIKTLTKNSVTITGLTAGKTYKYKVRSYIRNADGTKSYGAFSSVLNATTKLRTPTVKVVSNAKGQARISWSKVSGASGYEIYYKKTSSAKYKKLKTVNSPNIRVCTVRGMKSGDRAYFRIRAFRKNGSKKVYSSLNPLKVITVK